MKLPKITINISPEFADAFPDGDYTVGPGADPRPWDEKEVDRLEAEARRLLDQAARMREVIDERHRVQEAKMAALLARSKADAAE